MRLTSLCYLEQEGKLLLLHRVKKRDDPNRGKWIGIGGGFEPNESPEECMLREFREETGLTLTSYRFRGIVTFVSDQWEGEYMHLFTADGFTGALRDCDEGVLAWVPREEALNLPMWEGDRVFFRLLAVERPFFSIKLTYTGEKLTEAVLDGKPLEI